MPTYCIGKLLEELGSPHIKVVPEQHSWCVQASASDHLISLESPPSFYFPGGMVCGSASIVWCAKHKTTSFPIPCSMFTLFAFFLFLFFAHLFSKVKQHPNHLEPCANTRGSPRQDYGSWFCSQSQHTKTLLYVTGKEYGKHKTKTKFEPK